jgi:hypothetical protein
VLVDLYPSSICLDLNLNPDQLQQLEAIQGIELMLFNLFFLIALVILVSNKADFDLSLLLAEGLTTDRGTGPGRSPPTSTLIRGNAVRPFRVIVAILFDCSFEGARLLNSRCSAAVTRLRTDNAAVFQMHRSSNPC